MPSGRLPGSTDPRLARRLRELRKAAGMTAANAAPKIGWSQSKISRVERMRTGISAADVIVLLDLYDVEGPERTAIIDLAERSVRPRARIESAVYRNEAISADIWAPSVIPPALRIPDYARAVAESAMDITGTLPSEIEEMTCVSREWRRRIEDRRDPVQIQAVIDATALRRRVGQDDVMHRQVAHLAALDGLANVTLLVVLLDAAVPAAFPAFTLLRFSQAAGMPLASVAVFDDHADPRTVDAEAVTWRCRRAVKGLAAVAQPAAGAIAAALARWSR